MGKYLNKDQKQIESAKHMETDESEAVKNLRACEKILLTLFECYKARLFNTGGDSFLAEFPSAVSAVECAVEFQKLMKDRNSSYETTVQLEFRIGINSGDVIKEKGNLLGDGVNIAARLETLAQTNGITISKVIYDYVKGKTNFEFNDLGIQKVKQNEFHAYDVLLDPSQKRKLREKRSYTLLFFIMLTFLCISSLGVFYFNNNSNKVVEFEPLTKTNVPLILVKKFINIGSNDPAISNAFTESLVSSLSRFNGIKVLSSSTSVGISEKNISDEDVRENFGVNYVFEGSIQVFGKNIRLIIELVDFAENDVVWSDKFDFEINDIFKVQDQIGNIALGELQINAVMGQQAAEWMSEFDSFEQYLLHTNFFIVWNKFTRASFQELLEIRDELIELNANQNVINAKDAWIIHQRLLMGWSENIDEDLLKLDTLTKLNIEKRGLAGDYGIRAIVEMEHLSKDCSIAKPLSKKAAAIGLDAESLLIAGFIHLACGDNLKSNTYLKESLRLSPIDNGYMATQMYAANLFVLGKNDELKLFIGDKINNKDIWGMILWYYASFELENGDFDKAKLYFEKGKENGAKNKWIISNLRNVDAAENLIKALEPLSSLD